MRSVLVVLGTIFGFRTALATLTPQGNHSYYCLHQADAQQVADNYQALVSEYVERLAYAAFTANLTYYSSSVNILINSGCPSDPVPVRN